MFVNASFSQNPLKKHIIDIDVGVDIHVFPQFCKFVFITQRLTDGSQYRPKCKRSFLIIRRGCSQ